jgi:putative transferase (TIGR04331 family)
MEKRQWSLDKNDSSDDFTNILRKLIPLHIPIDYFEGYNTLKRISEKNSWPNSPKGIFTSVAYSKDDVFKIWAANKVEFGASLIIGQHGGHFGTSSLSFDESHQMKIADKFISWGWEDPNISIIKPVGNLKEFNTKVNYSSKGFALLVETEYPQYSYHLRAVPISSQTLYYFEDQYNFVNALPLALQEQVLVRLPGNTSLGEFNWSSELRWLDRSPNVRIDSRKQTIKSLVKDVRIVISTVNSTSLLESLIWNVPTIIFWDVKYWELKESVQPYFDLLESVGIFHKTPESAASKMIEVWDDVSVWWESDIVQDARNEFCSQFSANPKQFLSKLATVLQDV